MYLEVQHVAYPRPRPCNPLWTLSDYFVINCGSLHVVTVTYKTLVNDPGIHAGRLSREATMGTHDNALFPPLFKKTVIAAANVRVHRAIPRTWFTGADATSTGPWSGDSHITYLFIYQRPYNRPRRQGCCASTWSDQIVSGRLYIRLILSGRVSTAGRKLSAYYSVFTAPELAARRDIHVTRATRHRARVARDALRLAPRGDAIRPGARVHLRCK